MSENPAIYLKRLRMTGQIMFSYRPFVSQMFTVCFLEFSLYVFDMGHCLWQMEHQSDRDVSGLPQQELFFCLAAVFILLFLLGLHSTAYNESGTKAAKTLSYHFYKLEN